MHHEVYMEESTEHVAVPVAGTKPIQAVNPLQPDINHQQVPMVAKKIDHHEANQMSRHNFVVLCL